LRKIVPLHREIAVSRPAYTVVAVPGNRVVGYGKDTVVQTGNTVFRVVLDIIPLDLSGGAIFAPHARPVIVGYVRVVDNGRRGGIANEDAIIVMTGYRIILDVGLAGIEIGYTSKDIIAYPVVFYGGGRILRIVDADKSVP